MMISRIATLAAACLLACSLACAQTPRSPSDPEVSTFTELGFPSLEVEGWFAIFAPARTPQETVGRLNSVFVQAMRTPQIRERMRSLDLEIHEMNAAEFAAEVKIDYDRWGAIIKASGFREGSE